MLNERAHARTHTQHGCDQKRACLWHLLNCHNVLRDLLSLSFSFFFFTSLPRSCLFALLLIWSSEWQHFCSTSSHLSAVFGSDKQAMACAYVMDCMAPTTNWPKTTSLNYIVGQHVMRFVVLSFSKIDCFNKQYTVFTRSIFFFIEDAMRANCVRWCYGVPRSRKYNVCVKSTFTVSYRRYATHRSVLWHLLWSTIE